MNAPLVLPGCSHAARTEIVAARPDAAGLFLALAPMDGVTDAVYRHLMTALFAGQSGISLCVSEFIRVTDQLLPPPVFLRDCPELAHGGRTRAGVPVFVQLLGSNPQAMAANAKRAIELGALGVDLNFGCPAKTVNNHDGGACLLKTPSRVETVTRAVRDAVPLDFPVTAKVRLGWENSACVEEIALAAQRGGATWLTIHGRTRAQLYAPPVDWRAIGRARLAVTIPVVANGDLIDRASVEECARQSGCQSFMLGRATMGRPELFALVRGFRSEALPHAELMEVLHRYAAELACSPSASRALGLLKQWLRFGAEHRPELAPLFTAFKRFVDLEAALAFLRTWA